jgi:hypothetical protein
VEAHDGSNGDGPWVEVVDCDHRGLWLSRDKKISILRGKRDKTLYLWLSDDNNDVVLYNGETDGRIQICAENNIEIIASGDITIRANNINFKATEKIRLEAGGNPLTLEAGKMSTGGDIYGDAAHVRIAGVPSLDDVKAIAQNESASMVNGVSADFASKIKETLDSVGVHGNTVASVSAPGGEPVEGSLFNTDITFDPAIPSVPVPLVPSGVGDPQPGGDAVDDLSMVAVPDSVEPSDRGTVYNTPSVAEQDEIEHPITR